MSSVVKDVDPHLREDIYQELEEELRTQPLLDSVRSLVKKERQLAGLQLEEKDREAQLWRKKYIQLQTETAGIGICSELEENNPAKAFTPGSNYPDSADDDWDNLQAASKKTGDPFLGKLRSQESLNLSRKGIGRQDFDGIVTKLRWLRGFRSIDLSYNNIDDDCAQNLKNLMALRQLRRLDLRSNELGPSASKALLESLPRCRGLQVLRLEANVLFARLPGTGALLAASLRGAIKAGSCRHLWDLSVTLDDFDWNFFLNVPRKTKQTKQMAGTTATGLDRRSGKAATPLTPSPQAPSHPMNALAFTRAFHPRSPGGGIGALLNDGRSGEPGDDGGVLGKKSKPIAGSGRGSITSLGLPYARLHERTIEQLATHAISSLTHLNLSFCYIGAAGAVALARALGNNGKVDNAFGVGNEVGNSKDGGNSKDSGNHGRGSRSLRSLDLTHNSVGDSGARVLGRALRSNRCLTFLSLASNRIGPAGGRALAAALGSRPGGSGGDGGSALARLDVGDNPLGEKSASLLVAATKAAPSMSNRGDGRVSGAAVVRILGLDRVAGATVALRASARRAIADANAEEISGAGLREDGEVIAPVLTLLAVDEEVSVHPGDDATGDDGFVQVYQVQLDSRFDPPGEDVPVCGLGGGERYSTLDVEWSFAPGTTYPGQCHWRISRLRGDEPEFAVKEGVDTERWWPTASKAEGDEIELRDGYSRIGLRCNGWRTNDILKIFVRSPNGTGSMKRMKCCDLSIGLVGDTPPPPASPSRPPHTSSPSPLVKYDLLWADPGDVDEGCDNKGGWPEEDCPSHPSMAERAQIAYEMSLNRDSALGQDGVRQAGKVDGSGGGGAGAVHRLRQVHVAYGGRIRASWKAMLATASLDKALGGGESTRRLGDDQVGQQSLRCCGGYTWAIVRTRGAHYSGDGGDVGGSGDITDRCNVASWIIRQGTVSSRSPPRPPPSNDGGKVIHGETANSGNKEVEIEDFVGPTTSEPFSSTRSSPWRWLSTDVDTTAWLPGDQLSLWIRLDYADGNRCGDEASTVAHANAVRTGEERRRNVPLSHYPRVRGFKLEVIDDAAAEETARRSHCFLRRKRNPSRLPSTGGSVRQDGTGAENTGTAVPTTNASSWGDGSRTTGLGRASEDCFYAPAFSTAAAMFGGRVDAVQLDFASVSPMNIAAAGGSWA